MISWFEKHNKISLIMAILIAIFIFYMSSKTFTGGISGAGGSYKALVYHIGIYFILQLFLLFSLVRGKKLEFVLLCIVIAVLYGISDELHQFFVPGRYLSNTDIFYNSLGIMLASVLYLASIGIRNNIKTYNLKFRKK